MTKGEIILTIVVPVYNVGQYIYDCVDSIFSQLKESNTVEVIFINDGTKDDSINIIEKYLIGHNLKNNINFIIINQANKGLSGARNTGISIAKGKYIYFLDSDDYLHKDFFKKILPLLNEDYDIIEFNSIKFHYKKNKLIERYHRNIKNMGLNIVNNEDLRLDLFSWQDWAVWYRIFNRNLISENFFPEGYLYEDVMTVPFIYSKVEKVFSLDEYLIFYRMNPNSIMNARNTNCLKSTDHALNIFNKVEKSPYLNVVRSRFIIASVFNLIRNNGLIETFFWLKKNSIILNKSEYNLVRSKKLKLANKYPLLFLVYAFMKSR